MKTLATAALNDEAYFAFIDIAAKYSDRFSFEMNEPISEKAVQTKRNIIMETVLGSDVEPEMKERIIGQQLDALARAPVEMLQYYTWLSALPTAYAEICAEGRRPNQRTPVL